MCHVESCRTSINLCWMTESKQRAWNHPGQLGHVGHCSFSVQPHVLHQSKIAKSTGASTDSLWSTHFQDFTWLSWCCKTQRFSLTAWWMHLCSTPVMSPSPCSRSSFPPELEKEVHGLQSWSLLQWPWFQPLRPVPGPDSLKIPLVFGTQLLHQGRCHSEHTHAWRMSPENTDPDTRALKELIKL